MNSASLSLTFFLLITPSAPVSAGERCDRFLASIFRSHASESLLQGMTHLPWQKNWAGYTLETRSKWGAIRIHLIDRHVVIFVNLGPDDAPLSVESVRELRERMPEIQLHEVRRFNHATETFSGPKTGEYKLISDAKSAPWFQNRMRVMVEMILGEQ